MTASRPAIFLAETRRTRTLCRKHFEVILAVDRFPAATPGQFLQVLCRKPQRCAQTHRSASRQHPTWRDEVGRDIAATGPMLRRPFSIAGLQRDGAACEIDLIGRVVGAGTAWLGGLKPGDMVDVLGPLGRGFTPPPTGNHVLLLAGGIGWPPIRWWGKVLRQRNVHCESICGAQSRELLPVPLCREPSVGDRFTLCAEEFAAWGIPMIITTDDGTCGLKGRVTDGMLRYFAQSRDLARISVYACGPEPMLRAVASFCNQRGVACELAMECLMGCGMGTCQSCVVPIRDAPGDPAWHYALCCTDGPVFDAQCVFWPVTQ